MPAKFTKTFLWLLVLVGEICLIFITLQEHFCMGESTK